MRIDRDTNVHDLLVEKTSHFLIHADPRLALIIPNGEKVGTGPLQKTQRETVKNWQRYEYSITSAHDLCVGKMVHCLIHPEPRLGPIVPNVKDIETCPLKKTRRETDQNWRRYAKCTWSSVKSCGCTHGLCVGNEVQSKVTVPHRHPKNMEKCSKLEPISYFVVYKVSGRLVKYSLRCTNFQEINIPHPISQLSLRINGSFSSIDL